MLTDKDVEALTHEIDDILASLAIKHQVGFLSLAATINARLMRMAVELNGQEDLKRLLGHILTITTEGDYADYSKH